MTTKESILALFEEQRGVYFSGEEIAARLAVSRAAVWKAVNGLRKEGYEIDAVSNKGYRLAADTDILSTQGIEKYQDPVCRTLNLCVLPEAESTNTLLREKANAGAPEGTVILANTQTKGRGRRGRSFYSPADTGLYLSILLRPDGMTPDQAVKITTMAAVAVCEAVEEISGKLRKLREKHASAFAEEIRRQMTELNFLDTRLEIRVSDSGHYSANGRDEAEFYLAVNPGEPLKPLSNIASGGELSRIMLAIKAVLADEEDTPTLIFDEIDAGISGITADKVGEKLGLIGKSRQVICITHLPQIAAVADVHFVIRKEAAEGKARTVIERLDEESSVRELARILGGSKITDTILESAREMKELGKSDR